MIGEENVQTDDKLSYPYTIPPDDKVNVQINLGKINKHIQNPDSIFCGICQFPMAYSFELKPCKHKYCIDCIEKYPEECQKCGEEFKSIEIIKDRIL